LAESSSTAQRHTVDEIDLEDGNSELSFMENESATEEPAPNIVTNQSGIAPLQESAFTSIDVDIFNRALEDPSSDFDQETLSDVGIDDTLGPIELLEHILRVSTVMCQHEPIEAEPNNEDSFPEATSLPLSMSQLAAAWNEGIPSYFELKENDSLLHRSNLSLNCNAIRNFEGYNLTSAVIQPPGRLSFTESETKLLDTVQRTFDLDSFVLILDSLDAVLSNINMVYFNNYFDIVRHTLHTTIIHPSNSETTTPLLLHKHKNVYLGNFFVESMQFNIHIFFPNMKVINNETCFNSEQTRLWLEEILIPSVQQAIPDPSSSRHPNSYESARAHVESWKETVANPEASKNSRPTYPIPKVEIPTLWEAIKEHCLQFQSDDASVHNKDFENYIVMVSKHGGKAFTATPSINDTISDGHHWMKKHFNLLAVDLTNSYVDIGIEDTMTPNPTTSARPTTFLHRKCCLQEWIKQHHDTETTSRLKSNFYNWALTEEAGSAEFECTSTNKFHRAGLVHGKSYNIVKELFQSPVRGHQPFSHPLLDFCGLDQNNIDHILDLVKEHNKKRSNKTIDRKHVVDNIARTKGRLGYVLNSPYKNWGVRQEYRIRLNTFIAIDDRLNNP
jgi:hypothetical protein